jgi:Ca2+:H+ antiporter
MRAPVAVGSSIQIAVGVVPILVLAGWAMGRELTLQFGQFETVCLFLSILLVNLVSGDGLSNVALLRAPAPIALTDIASSAQYLEGLLLVALYIIMAVAFYVSP